MPFLYLFTIQNLNHYIIERNFAIISKNSQDKLDELNEGDITDIFNESILEKEIIIEKLVITFSIENFDKIILNYTKNCDMYIKNEKNNYFCFIDNQKYFIENYVYDENNKIYNYICIFDT